MAVRKIPSHPKENRVPDRGRAKVDGIFLFLVLLLLALGLGMLYSASSAQSLYDTNYATSVLYFSRQALCALLGLGCMALFSRLKSSVWEGAAWAVYGLTILLLLLVLVAGESVNGARRWITVAGIQFQPSELAKFALVLTFARLGKGFGPKAKDFRYGVLGFGAAMLGILVPLALEKHLSAIVLLGAVGVILMFLSGTKARYLMGGAALGLAFVGVYVSLMGYAGDRVTAWLHPEADPSDTGYQILQSLYAIGSGGLFGLGYGKGRQKYLYLPFQYNDYIFAVVCEELGLFGALAILVIFALLIARGYWISGRLRNRFSALLCAGLTTLIAVQTMLNICIVTNLLPSTGVALPFFSYGGTALAVNLGEMGIILGLSRESQEETL